MWWEKSVEQSLIKNIINHCPSTMTNCTYFFCLRGKPRFWEQRVKFGSVISNTPNIHAGEYVTFVNPKALIVLHNVRFPVAM